jgi:LysR family transcriptional regulator, glycine cleavage system transcriptional activator
MSVAHEESACGYSSGITASLSNRFFMKRATPTTQSLLAFAASARHLSFTKASVELCLTQGAVSRQVAGLEGFVRTQLFERLNPGLALTAAGKNYLPRVEAALRDLEAATLDLLAFGGKQNQISVAFHPTLAAVWLLPRLAAFRQAFPDVMLNLLPAVWSDPIAPSIDIAIRFGEGSWPGLDAHYLLGREFVAVAAASPTSTGSVKAKRTAGSVSRAAKKVPQRTHDLATSDVVNAVMSNSLLHHVQVPDAWPEALTHWGITADTHPAINAYAGPRFAQFSALLQAAASGFGIAIVPAVLAEDDLQRGRIVRLIDRPAILSRGYYVCTPQSKRNNALVQTVMRWMLTEASSHAVG